ncbi:MAG: glycosyltransferase family 2 protein [Terriglobia bacterium]
MSSPSVSVCIITRNRMESLSQCLRCIALQTHPAAEIIIVDNSTNFATRDFVNGHLPSARYIHANVSLGSFPTLRNIAWKHASADFVAFTDDDCYPQPSWLAALLGCYAADVGAVGGRVVDGPVDEGNGSRPPVVGILTPLRGALGNFNAVWPEPFDVDHIPGGNMSFRRESLVKAGGWDYMLESGYAPYEETELCLRIKRLGYRVIYTPHSVVQDGLVSRQGGFARDAGRSLRQAYSISRNAAYTIFKSYRIVPSVLVGAGILAPIVNIKRLFFPKDSGRPRRFALSITRLLAAAGIAAGHVAGLCALLRLHKRKSGNAWHRLRFVPQGLAVCEQTGCQDRRAALCRSQSSAARGA